MPKLTDPAILTTIATVLSNWNYTDYVTAKEVAYNFLATLFPALDRRDLVLKHVAKLMYQHVSANGDIHYARETRPEYNHREYHYDFSLTVAGRTKLLYLETILVDDDPDDPTIHIVSAHDDDRR